jgi:hypothetical protein
MGNRGLRVTVWFVMLTYWQTYVMDTYPTLSLTLTKDKTVPLEFAWVVHFKEPVQRSWCSEWAWTAWDSNPGGGKRFFSLPERPDLLAEARSWCGATSTRPMHLLGVERKTFYRFTCFQISLLCGNEFPNWHFLRQNGINCNDFNTESEKWNKTDNALCSNFYLN